jgi:hypothetical protein
MLNSLLRKLIKTASGRTRFVMAIIGLSVALLLILSAVQIQANYNELLNGKTNQDSTANFLVLNKEVNSNTINATNLSDGELKKLKAQPFIDAVGTISPSKFKASIESYTQNFPFRTDIAFESVQDDFIDVNSEEWKWDENSSFIPMIIPNMFLDMYNFQFSISQNFPQITPTVLKTISFKVSMFGPDGSVQSHTGRIVGFSDRISSVIVPKTFMDWANNKYSSNSSAQPSRVVIRTKDPGNPELVDYLKKNGLKTDADKTRFSKYRQIVNAVVGVSWVTGLMMLLFALLIFTLFIQLTIASCKEEIQLLITLGAAPKQLQRFLMKRFFPSNVVIVLVALTVISLLQYGLAIFLQKQNIFLSKFTSWYTFAVAGLVLVALWLLNLSTIKKYINQSK